jgi:hypothetical protein
MTGPPIKARPRCLFLARLAAAPAPVYRDRWNIHHEYVSDRTSRNIADTNTLGRRCRSTRGPRHRRNGGLVGDRCEVRRCSDGQALLCSCRGRSCALLASFSACQFRSVLAGGSNRAGYRRPNTCCIGEPLPQGRPLAALSFWRGSAGISPSGWPANAATRTVCLRSGIQSSSCAVSVQGVWTLHGVSHFVSAQTAQGPAVFANASLL